MTHVGYVVAGYGLTAAVLLGYVLRLRSGGRALARSSPASLDGPGPGTDAPTAAANADAAPTQ